MSEDDNQDDQIELQIKSMLETVLDDEKLDENFLITLNSSEKHTLDSSQDYPRRDKRAFSTMEKLPNDIIQLNGFTKNNNNLGVQGFSNFANLSLIKKKKSHEIENSNSPLNNFQTQIPMNIYMQNKSQEINSDSNNLFSPNNNNNLNFNQQHYNNNYNFSNFNHSMHNSPRMNNSPCNSQNNSFMNNSSSHEQINDNLRSQIRFNTTLNNAPLFSNINFKKNFDNQNYQQNNSLNNSSNR